MSKKPIVVINTQLILRATLNARSLPAKLFFELGSHYILAISPGIRFEVNEVLNRPKLRAKFSALTDEAISRTLAVLDAGQEVVPESIPAVSRDPKDDIFLETAVVSGAQFLVTEDNDLLVLNPYKDVQILNALDFLKAIQNPPDLKDKDE